MKHFLAVFLGSSESANQWESLDEKTREAREQEGMAAWGAWVQRHKTSIVDHGSPLGSTLKVNRQGVSKTQNDLCAYTVVKADSHDDAAKLFVDHPHFMIFPGDSVEIMECLPIPS